MFMRPPWYGVQSLAALSPGGAPAYDPDADAYFAYAGALGDPRKQLISDLIAGIKTDLSLTNLSDKFDGFWLLANETATAALKNIAKNDHHCTATNSPTFTADRGYAGDGSTSYLATDYAPSVDGVALTANSASLGVYNRTARTTGSGCNIGCQSPNQFTIHTSWSNVAYMCLFGTENSNNTPGTSQGFWVGSRTGASTESNYRNGSSIEDPNSATGALVSAQLFIGAGNSGGAFQFTTDEHAFAFVGGGLTAGQVASLTTRVETYMDAIGAGVI